MKIPLRHLFLTLLPLIGPSRATSQETEERLYILDEFDFNTEAWNNDFFALRGVWEYSSARVTASYQRQVGYHHELKLAYDVSAASSEGD